MASWVKSRAGPRHPFPTPHRIRRVNCVIGLLMGGLTHGCAAREADGLPAEPLLTGAALPQCPAASEPWLLHRCRAKRDRLPQTGAIRFPNPVSGSTTEGGAMVCVQRPSAPASSCSPIQAGACVCPYISVCVDFVHAGKTNRNCERKTERRIDAEAAEFRLILMELYNKASYCSELPS